jgi:hypothetical protein
LIDSFLKECMVRAALEGDLTGYDYTDEEDCNGEPGNDTSCELQAAQHHDSSTVDPKPLTKSAGRHTGRRYRRHAYAEAKAAQQGQRSHDDTTFAFPTDKPLEDTGRCSGRRHRKQALKPPLEEDSDLPNPPVRGSDSVRWSARRHGKCTLQQAVGTPEDDALAGLKQITKRQCIESTKDMIQLGFYIDSCIDLTVPGWIATHPNDLPKKVFTKEELLRDYQM